MKVAVSIPDAVFAETELLVKRLKTSRSEVYARALTAFVGNHQSDRLTQAMNEAVDAAGEISGPFEQAAARAVLSRTEW